MDQVRKKLRVDDARRKGFRGLGVTVAVMDTGIVPHPDFDSRIVKFKDYTRGMRKMYDDNGHGTHVAGIIAGSGKMSHGLYQGMAPGSSLYIQKVLDRKGNGNTGQMLSAIDEVIEEKEKYNIRILNISVGMLPTADDSEKEKLMDAVEKAWRAGIVVVAAAGNNGPGRNSVTIPGQCKSIITVGSIDDYKDQGHAKGPKAGYSGRGPTDCCVVKPEILAPGTSIKSCSYHGNGYEMKSGTSMSAPVISGAIALLLEKYPRLTPAQVKLKFYERAVMIREVEKQECWGVVYLNRLL
ncbi:MAG: S8 family peptidase [Lachnospiraceae bacterium]|jgi:Subtilisin-like serine proteases|uniref:S8 family peptidase n=1 Tax=Roseburia sp. 1XD42-69 TaxID=2320088 RepID=UPI000EA1D4FA|nr:S8 family peptidase [Roseburia sp. 1XD42-69]MCI8874550.1 S8 family peptidase [Lachnospiraceae bacterium]MCX4320567.1 S8 family peptidase [Lachnospiraceae bacterium]RKJ68425.1 peptidase S8 [Roseburia sp. 1XD42-69]